MTSGEISIKYLLDDLSHLEEKIARTDLLLFLDYDGTLVPFRNRPEEALPSDELKEILKELSTRYSVLIVSGRAVEDLKKMLLVDGLSLVGLHGMERECDGEYRLWKGAGEVKALIEEIRGLLECNFNEELFLGAAIEDKRFAVALHYRTFLGDEDELKKKFAGFVEIYKNKVDIVHGSKVIEVRPLGCNKGKAVKDILDKRPAHKEAYPIYIGDDTTDEDAFLALRDCGHTVLVSATRRATNAKYYLSSREEVIEFLKWLLKR